MVAVLYKLFDINKEFTMDLNTEKKYKQIMLIKLIKKFI